jgi:hypothetical protein
MRVLSNWRASEFLPNTMKAPLRCQRWRRQDLKVSLIHVVTFARSDFVNCLISLTIVLLFRQHVKQPGVIRWCTIRQTVFSWTRTRFPLHSQSARKLTMSGTPVVTVIGKAFWDIGHAPKDQSNRRKYLPGYAVWEIHPVMKLEPL